MPMYMACAGRFDPLQDAARPVTRVVPHATAAAAVAALGDSVAAAAYTIAPSAGLPNKR